MDQELADAAVYAPGRRCICTHQMVALFCVKWRHGHLESMTSCQKSDYVNRCVFTWWIFLPNVIPIRFEMTEPFVFFEEVAPTRRRTARPRTTRWV